MPIKCAPECKGKLRGKCQPCYDFDAKQNPPICFKDRFYVYRDQIGYFQEKGKDIENFTYLGFDLFVKKVAENNWNVTEGRSGLIVQYGHSKIEAISNSRKKIKSVGKEEVENLITDSVKRHGLSPRYKNVD